MPHLIEPASSGRSRCRGCQQKIEKDRLRLGVAVPNPFGDGETHHYYHLLCGALRQPEAFLEVADSDLEAASSNEETSLEIEKCGEHAKMSQQHRRLRRLVRAERASSGRARCRHCRETIDKGSYRFALEIVDDGMANAAGFVHVTCAPDYVGTTNYMMELVAPRSELHQDELEEVRRQLEAGQTPSG